MLVSPKSNPWSQNRLTKVVPFKTKQVPYKKKKYVHHTGVVPARKETVLKAVRAVVYYAVMICCKSGNCHHASNHTSTAAVAIVVLHQ